LLKKRKADVGLRSFGAFCTGFLVTACARAQPG
jgi:hypothetical protein